MNGGKGAVVEPTLSAPEGRVGSVVVPLESRRVGRYALGRQIGAGEMGVVYEAFDPDLNRNVALELVHPQQSGAPGAQERILEQARTLAKISHPNVVPIHDCGVADQTVYIVMELIAGSTLGDWLKARRRSRRETLEVFGSAGEGLAAAHRVGLAHGDFKPANVLLGPSGRVFVTDFALQGGENDPSADQVAFCLALQEALIGQNPDRASRRPRALAPKLGRVIARGFAAHRVERFSTMDELLSELRLALVPLKVTHGRGAPVLRMEDRQGALRHRLFVGRKQELELLGQALRAGSAQGQLWFLHGPGGVGKTTLIQELTHQTPRGGASVVRLDLRDIVPSPDSFRAGLAEAMGLPGQTVTDGPGWPSQWKVLVLDNVEAIGPLERWLRDTFLPTIPERVHVICVSRNEPSAEWKSCLAGRASLHAVPLAMLSPGESREILVRRKVPLAAQADIVGFAHGHPLALSLAADLLAQHAGPLDLGTAPDLIQALLRRFVDQVPSTLHRTALDVCAVVRSTSEAILGRFIEASHTHEVWTWLRGLSFMQETAAKGLAPHDLVRTSLLADFKWRNVEHLRAMKADVIRFDVEEVRAGSATEQEIAMNFWYMERDNPIYSVFVPIVENGPVVDVATVRDVPDIVAMTREHEGDASAAIVAHWFEHQPEATVVIRASAKDPSPIGFMMTLALERTTAAERARDPAAKLAWDHLETLGAAVPDRAIVFKRFWMAQGTYQDLSPVQSLCTSYTMQNNMFLPDFGFFLVVYADPEPYAAMNAYLKSKTIGEFQVGGRGYTLLGRDWRGESPLRSLLAMICPETP